MRFLGIIYQFYKELKIGSCQPSPKQLDAVKHHFIAHLSVNNYYNVSRFESDVLNLLNNLFNNTENLQTFSLPTATVATAAATATATTPAPTAAPAAAPATATATAAAPAPAAAATPAAYPAVTTVAAAAPALMVGGSGLYINAVCNGIDDLPDPDHNLRLSIIDNFNKYGIEHLKLQLFELDPEYYNMVDLSNPNRLMRAIEVCLQTGRKYSELRIRKHNPRDFNIIKIGIQRDINELYDIINHRVDSMIDLGLVDEASQLYPLRHLNALNTVGYKELFLYFDGLISLKDAILKIKTNTRHYAKRQFTWFRKDKDTKWFFPDQKDDILKYISNILK